MPCSVADQTLYFNELFDTWFPKEHLPKNFSYQQNKRTFTRGGYYRHDFEGTNEVLIVLNSVVYMRENKCMLAQGGGQLLWLFKQLRDAPSNKRFTLAMHVPPGLEFMISSQNALTHFWHPKFESKFIEITS